MAKGSEVFPDNLKSPEFETQKSEATNAEKKKDQIWLQAEAFVKGEREKQKLPFDSNDPLIAQVAGFIRADMEKETRESKRAGYVPVASPEDWKKLGANDRD